MKKIFVVLSGLCVASMLQAQVRTEQLLEKGWKFTREDKVEFSQVGYDDAKWQSVTVPHDWAIYGPFSINNDKQNIAITQDGQKEAMEHAGRTGGLPFVGVGWYRLGFEAPSFEKGKKVLFPRCDKKTHTMEYHIVNSLDELKPDSYGLLEPPEDAPIYDCVNETGGAVCFVPGLVYDKAGYRLGYGGGYYDRFLSQFSGMTVGINYSECVRDELQPGRYDVPIQMLLTEREKLYFK